MKKGVAWDPQAAGPDGKEARARWTRLKTIRASLGLSQPAMAAALRISPNTLKGWEAGRPIPDIALVLAELLHDIPAVRKRLIEP